MKTIDQYFPVVVRSTFHNDSEKRRQRNDHRWHPYGKPNHSGSRSENRVRRPMTRAEATNFLLRTLSSPHNPITHSDMPERADRVISTATGHQVAEQRMNRRLYFEDRERKLVNQREKVDQKGQILTQARIYIDGYLEDTTDIEIKRLITLAGGQTIQTPNCGCTHIVTSRCLSASKMQTLFAGRSIGRVQIVRPEWVIDSISKGKKQPEYQYSILQDITRK